MTIVGTLKLVLFVPEVSPGGMVIMKVSASH